MKICGVTIIRDYEEIKRMRRDALTDKENIEFFVEHGSIGMLKRKCVYRISGGDHLFPLYTLSFKKAVFITGSGIIWNLRQLKNRLFPPKSSVRYEHNRHNADSEQ